jgi:futalosine hydrolase
LENGAVALAESEAYADLGLPAGRGMEAVGIPLLTRGRRKFYNEFPLDRTLLGRARRVLGRETPAGLFLTVSSLPDSPRRARALGRRFGAICENMEGAAVAQTGLRYGVPVLEVRGISNRAGDRDRSRWLIEPAAKNAQQAVLDILPAL